MRWQIASGKLKLLRLFIPASEAVGRLDVGTGPTAQRPHRQCGPVDQACRGLALAFVVALAAEARARPEAIVGVAHTAAPQMDATSERSAKRQRT